MSKFSDTSLEEMLKKMQIDLDNKKQVETIDTFEKEQEEHAIISYNELLVANGVEIEPSVESYVDSNQLSIDLPDTNTIMHAADVIEKMPKMPIIDDEPSSVFDNRFEQISLVKNEDLSEDQDIEVLSFDDFIITSDYDKKDKPVDYYNPEYNKSFTGSDIISPIYGVVKDKDSYQKQYDEFDSNKIVKTRVQHNKIMEEENEFLNNLKRFRENLD